MSRDTTVRQPLDLALTLEKGQSFRWGRVGNGQARRRNLGGPAGAVATGWGAGTPARWGSI